MYEYMVYLKNPSSLSEQVFTTYNVNLFQKDKMVYKFAYVYAPNTTHIGEFYAIQKKHRKKGLGYGALKIMLLMISTQVLQQTLITLKQTLPLLKIIQTIIRKVT